MKQLELLRRRLLETKIIDPSIYVIYRLKANPISTVLGATQRISIEFKGLESDPKVVQELLDRGWNAHRFDKNFKKSIGEYIDV